MLLPLLRGASIHPLISPTPHWGGGSFSHCYYLCGFWAGSPAHTQLTPTHCFVSSISVSKRFVLCSVAVIRKNVLCIVAMHSEQIRCLKSLISNAMLSKNPEGSFLIFLSQLKPNLSPTLWGWQKSASSSLPRVSSESRSFHGSKKAGRASPCHPSLEPLTNTLLLSRGLKPRTALRNSHLREEPWCLGSAL